MPTSNRLVFRRWSKSNSVTNRTAVYGPVRTVVWQGSVGDHRPYADLVAFQDIDISPPVQQTATDVSQAQLSR
jgi:hypothetical protein